MIARADALTRGADAAARLSRVGTQQGRCQRQGCALFANPTRTFEQVGVRDAVVLERVA
jgi:hypothetical protein